MKSRTNPRAQPASAQQIDAIVQLPKAKQRFVSQMLETVLAHAAR